MTRPKRLYKDSSADVFYLWIALFAFAAFIIGAAMSAAHADSADKTKSGTTNICVDIKLPVKGKCVNFTYNGYTAKVCLP